MHRRIVFGLVLGAAALVAAPASAQAAGRLSVTPSTTAPGTTVHVSGMCEPKTSGFAISHAFLHDAAHDFAGVGAVPFSTDAAGAFSVDARVPATIRSGSYAVTARCGGGNLGVTATLTVAGTVPTAVPAGNGGEAATPGGTAETWWLGGSGLALAAVGGGALLRRRQAR
jgi:hypothetical protein